MKNGLVCFFVMFFCFSSCGDAKYKATTSILQEWEGKTIRFPSDMVFTIQLKDTVKLSVSEGYKILTYVDSVGCISCKLRLDQWKTLIADMELMLEPVQFLFFFSPNKQSDVYRTLKISNFSYPICIDETNSLNKLNHFPTDMAFQTFLLDKDNKVVAIGNPVHNPKVKELYLKIIQGKEGTESKKLLTTEIEVKEQTISLGRFNWKEEKKAVFKIKNIGDRPLVINDVATSCGCTSVDYPKEPVRPGDSLSLQVTYKADHPEHFDKTITVYCNANPSLVRLKITGDAE